MRVYKILANLCTEEVKVINTKQLCPSDWQSCCEISEITVWDSVKMEGSQLVEGIKKYYQKQLSKRRAVLDVSDYNILSYTGPNLLSVKIIIGSNVEYLKMHEYPDSVVITYTYRDFVAKAVTIRQVEGYWLSNEYKKFRGSCFTAFGVKGPKDITTKLIDYVFSLSRYKLLSKEFF